MADDNSLTSPEKKDEAKNLPVPEIKNDIDLIPGNTNILLIAPHGHKDDDENTGKLVRLMAEQSGSYAIINEIYQKPDPPDEDEIADKTAKKVNLNRRRQVEEHLAEEFLGPLLKYKDEIVSKFDNVIILWIHGARDLHIKRDMKPKRWIGREAIKVIMGYGQNTRDNSTYTAEPNPIWRLKNGLNKNDLNATDASVKKNKFCASDIHNMNQYFRLQGIGLKKVNSIQLEFRMKDCRDTEDNIQLTATRFSKAISGLITSVPRIPSVEEDPLIEKAYTKLSSVFSKNYEQALIEAGQYLVRTFYGGEENIENLPYEAEFEFKKEVIKRARDKDSPRKETLNRLYKKIDATVASNTPSKVWIYNAVNLVVQGYDVKTELETCFYTYKNLFLSKKICLLRSNNITTKQKLIDYDCENTLTVEEFKIELADLEPQSEKVLDLPALLKRPEELLKEENEAMVSLPALKGIRIDALKRYQAIADVRHQNIEQKIGELEKLKLKQEEYRERYVGVKADIKKAIEFKESEPQQPKKKASKAKTKGTGNSPLLIGKVEDRKPDQKPKSLNQDWADEGINVSTGCSNNCRYCYARDGQIRNGIKTLETWHIEEPRDAMLTKGWRKTTKRKLFPSIHDITPGTYENCAKVIKNFLAPGNTLLIVSKPHPDLIKKLCDEIKEYKDQVLFRFTISATDNDILKFWEPNAPLFEERLEALKIAREKGFETSISVEPMLDTANISELITALEQYTSDSIWLGTLNGISRRIKNKDDEEVKNQIEKIKAGQTSEKLLEIYEKYKDNPLIKWKGHIREALKEIEVEVPEQKDDWREKRIKDAKPTVKA